MATEKECVADRLPREGLGTPSRFWIDRTLPQVLSKLVPRDGSKIRILDLGCNDGAYLDLLRDSGFAGEYVGIDLKAWPEWDERDMSGPLTAEFRTWDAHNLARLRPPGFDLIIAITTFEHFRRDEEVLHAVVEQLSGDGKFVLVVPAPQSFALYGPHGFRRYPRRATERRLKEAGLRCVSYMPGGGITSFFMHAAWFNASQALALSGKAVLAVLAGCSRQRARRWFTSADLWLNGLMLYHQRFALGRKVHRKLNFLAAKADERIPGLPAMHLFVTEKTREGRKELSTEGLAESRVCC